MVDWILEGLQAVWSWFLDLMVSIGVSIWGGVIEGLPTVGNQSLDTFSSWLLVVNQYVPIDALLVAISTYWTFLGVFVGVKAVLKLLPGVG